MEAISLSLDVFCMIFLLFVFFGLAVSAYDDEYYGYPRKVREPSRMLNQYSRGYVGHPQEADE